MTHLDEQAARCNYTGYMEKYVTYPPQGLLPLPGTSTTFDQGCDVWDEIFNNALIINPAFDIYRIWDTVSGLVLLWTLGDARLDCDFTFSTLFCGMYWDSRKRSTRSILLPRFTSSHAWRRKWLVPTTTIADLLQSYGGQEGHPRASQYDMDRMLEYKHLPERRRKSAACVYSPAERHREE